MYILSTIIPCFLRNKSFIFLINSCVFCRDKDTYISSIYLRFIFAIEYNNIYIESNLLLLILTYGLGSGSCSFISKSTTSIKGKYSGIL